MTRPPRWRPGASGAATLLPHVRREGREAFEGGRRLDATETAWEREFDAAGLPKRVLAATALRSRPEKWLVGFAYEVARRQHGALPGAAMTAPATMCVS